MLGFLMRFIVAALVILFLGFLLPGFSILGFWSAIGIALAIALAGWAVEAVVGHRVSAYGRGLVGFAVAVVVLYGAQFLMTHARVSVVGALIAGLIIGVIDAFVPSETHA